jgi:hypothetical protein
MREAINIGSLFRKYLITTYVRRSSKLADGSASDPATPNGYEVCASACALTWLGGVERIGTVGLHRPRISDPDFANSPPEEAMTSYRKLLSAMEAYLVKIEVPRPVIDTVLATSSSEINWVDAITDHLSRPPSYAEWEDASCTNKFDPDYAPLSDACRRPLRLEHIAQLSPP